MFHAANSNLKRRVVLVTSAMLCLAAVEGGVRLGKGTLDHYDRRFNQGGYARRHSEMENLRRFDIILMGSSRAMYALVPEEFSRIAHRKAYNLALTNSKTADWQIFARRLLDHQRPPLIILGVNAGAFFHNYLPEKAAFLLFDLNDLFDSFRREGISSEVISNYARSRLGHAWSFYGRGPELKLYIQEKMSWFLPKYAQLSREQRVRATCPTPPNGFEYPAALGRHIQTLQESLDEDGVIHHRQDHIPQYVPDASPYGRFGDLLAFFNDQHIPVIIAYLPNSPRAESRWRDVEPKIIQRLFEMCSARGIHFINCRNMQLPRMNRDYLDEIHVTLPLARRISRYIANTIMDMNLLEGDSPQIVQGPARSEKTSSISP